MQLHAHVLAGAAGQSCGAVRPAFGDGINGSQRGPVCCDDGAVRDVEGGQQRARDGS